MIPCQKFFGEPVLITTFVLSGRFYHRSKKDVIRLSMATVTDVDCLNIITIRLSIVFGDCMQSTEVKSNELYGMKHTVQEFLLHHDLLGVQIFHIMEKGLFIVQMIKSKANNVCMRGQDN